MNITSSLQQNGWCKLPNGLIIQWGKTVVVASDGEWHAFNWNINFTTYSASTQVTCPWRPYYGISERGDLQGTRITIYTYNGPDGGTDLYLYYLAIGY